jgi:hypothetical protein
MRDDQKDLYLTDISNHYASIPSHDLEYHVSRRHDFIGIVVTDDKSALWAASRFKSLHREQVWIEMQKYCNANSVETYAQTLKDFSWLVAQHSKNLISLEDIKSGNAITTLELILGYKLTPESEILYERWLKSINLTL